MFEQRHRLRKDKDIEAVLRGGIRLSGRFFKVRALTNNRTTLRITVVVGSKTAKKAVDRNRIKRRTRAAARKSVYTLSGWDIILFPTFETKNAPLTQLIQELQNHVETLHRRHRHH